MIYNPYQYIREHYESMYPCVGSKVFSILSLIPISLILPKLIINNRPIRIHLNFMWLSPSGMAKSSIAKEFSKITYNPLLTKKMSTPRLYYELKSRKGTKTSLIVEDVAVWFMDDEKIKFLEGVTGEEESMSHETMRNIKDTEKHTDLVSFCSGTPENITNARLKEGILRRFYPLIIYLSNEENKKIIRFINGSVGENKDLKDSEEIIDFYQSLYRIQNNEHPEIEPIIGYMPPTEAIKNDVADFMEQLTGRLNKKYGGSFATEAEEFWRLAVCYAFLNVYKKHRDGLIQDNHLILTEEDIKIAKLLIQREISTKSIILQCIEQMDYWNIKTREQLRAWEDRRKRAGQKPAPVEAKFLMESNVKR